MIRLEYVGIGDHGEDSAKYWAGEVIPGTGEQGDFFVLETRWGRITKPGNPEVGQSGQKTFTSRSAAEAELAKKVTEKIRKGYVNVGAQ